MWIYNWSDLIESYVTDSAKEIFDRDYPFCTSKPYNNFYNEKDGKLYERFTQNCWSLYFSMAPDLCDKLNARQGGNFFPKKAKLQIERFSYGAHTLKNAPSKIETITTKNIIDYLERVASIYPNKKAYMMSILDPEYGERIKKAIFNEYNENKNRIFESPLYMKENNETDMMHCLYAFNYTTEDRDKVIKYMKEDHIKDFPEELVKIGVFKNNRLYLPGKDGNFLVLSKNPYDYIWASTGNGYQSCFSLESDYWGIQDMPMLATQSWHFMLYETTLGLNEYSLFNHKFDVPSMVFRCWTYRTERGMMRDKPYGRNDRQVFNFESTADILGIIKDSNGYERGDQDRINPESDNYDEDFYIEYIKLDLKEEDDDVEYIYNKYRTYCDSIHPEMEGYLFDVGYHQFTRSMVSNTRGHSIKFSVKNLFYNENLKWVEGKTVGIVDNKLDYIKVCPITSFNIRENEEKHWSAKYLDKPVKSMAILTIDTTSDNPRPAYRIVVSNRTKSMIGSTEYAMWILPDGNIYTPIDINLKKVKEALKDVQENNPQYDCLLLRIIEGSKVTYQPFYAKKEAYL